MTAPRPLIDHNQMLDVLGIDGELLLGAAEAALPTAARNPVPGCPDSPLARPCATSGACIASRGGSAGRHHVDNFVMHLYSSD